MYGNGPASGFGTTRFTPADFKYNGRVAAALLPCLLTVAVVGGAPVLGCLTVGAMVVYLMDAMQYREGAFSCAWLTLAAADVAFTASLLSTSDAPVELQIAMIFAMLFLSILTGMWASLQFKWLQMQYPAAAIYFERCVLTASLPLAAVVQPLGLATVVPYSDVPYYMALLLLALYHALGRPLVSSFYNLKAGPAALGGGPAAGPEAVVQTRADGALLAALAALLPPAAYAAIHWAVLSLPLHVYSMLLLAGTTHLGVALLPGGMWWLAPGAASPINAGGVAAGRSPSSGLAGALRKALIVAALVAALVGFEGRVVFHGFGQYIRLPPPWNWLAVSFALFGCAAVAAAHASGALGRGLDVTAAGSFLLLCTTAGSLAAGVPFPWLPAPLLAACGLSLFYESRSLREYLVFVVGALLTFLWFMRQHFWFLDILVSGWPLHTLCKGVVAALVPALCVPGLVLAGSSPRLIGGLLLLQAGLVAGVEEALYGAGREDGAADPMYPGWMVVATSVLGLAAARLLAARGHLTPVPAWLLHSTYAAKLAMLLLPETELVLPATLLAAAALAPLFLYGPSVLHVTPAYRAASAPSLATSSPSSSSAPAASLAPRRPRRPRLAPWQGLVHLLSILLAVALARFAVFDIVQFLISSRPSEGLLLGALALTAAAALAPLALHCYGGGGRLGRAAAALAVLGLLLAALQPPLPLAGGARCPRLPLSLCPRLWDERHVPMHSAEDVEVWGRGLGRREQWPRWLLIGAAAAALATTGGGGPAGGVLAPARRLSAAGRLALGGGAGLLLGAYTALELLPGRPPLQVLVTLSSILAALFVVGLAAPPAAARPPSASPLLGPIGLPALALAWAVAAGLSLLLQAELPVPLDRATARLFPDSKIQVEAELYAASRAALLAVAAAHAALMAFALRLRAAAALRRRPGAKDDAAGAAGAGPSRAYPSSGPAASDLLCGVAPSALFARYCAMLRTEGAAGLLTQRLAAEGLAWVPTLGNLLTLTALALGLALNAFLAGSRGGAAGGAAGPPAAIFMLAPLLLLLSPDPLLLPGLAERQRYCPPAAAVSGYLLLSGLAAAAMGAASGLAAAASAGGRGGMGAAAAAGAGSIPPLLYLAKEVGLAALATPHHVLFLRYLWTQRPAPWGLALLLAAPACLLPAAMAEVAALRYFGAVGAVAAVLQYFSMKHVRHVGMKVI